MERADLANLIEEAALSVGASAPRIADHIIASAYPLSVAATKEEGCEAIFRRGLIDHVARHIRNHNPVPAQADFAEIAEGFRPFVGKLKSGSYFVPSSQEYIGVAQLIAEPAKLDEARQFMRAKGNECLAEAQALDLLFEAVTGDGSTPANDTSDQSAAA